MSGNIFVVVGTIFAAIALGFWMGEIRLRREKSGNMREVRPDIEEKDRWSKRIQPDISSAKQAYKTESERITLRKNINRIYNVYLARSIREGISGPKTFIILCKGHYKRYKEFLMQDPGTYVLKGRKTDSPCWWCENPDEVEKLWGDS